MCFYNKKLIWKMGTESISRDLDLASGGFTCPFEINSVITNPHQQAKVVLMEHPIRPAVFSYFRVNMKF